MFETATVAFFRRALVFSALALAVLGPLGCGGSSPGFVFTNSNLPGTGLPTDALQIMSKELYRESTFALRVEDAETGEVVHELNSSDLQLIGSVRKVFDTGLLLEKLGSDFRFRTPVYRQGSLENGVLNGDLVLVATGDLTMGGRRGPNDTIALTDLDHSEANAVGNAVSPSQDPLAGYRDLAEQVAAAGVTEIAGEVIIDDRLFEPFDFRGQFMANAVFVNDNLVDVNMSPTSVGQPAEVVVSPLSQAFGVVAAVETVAGDASPEVELDGGECFGVSGCQGTVSGTLPIDGQPLFTGQYPFLRTFRITNPSAYARTVFIEELRDAGVTVNAPTVGANPVALLPTSGSYSVDNRVAVLVSPPLSEYARYILKVSYNLGADTALVLLGLTQGATSVATSMEVEQEQLSSAFGIESSEYSFVDGSGGGETRATPTAVNRFLRKMATSSVFDSFRLALPVVGAPGVRSAVPAISNNPSLAGSVGSIFAKSGTFATLAEGGGIQLRARAEAGYITARSGRRLVFTLVVNEVGPFESFSDTFEVSHDLATIAAILWREH